jgi:non-ribosomal peptide synthetase component F
VITATVHRIVEQHAALRGSAVAVVDGDRSLTYRDLNYAANGLARRLLTTGFRRGAHATVTMPAGIDLAVTLLATLKLGGSYTWTDPGPLPTTPPGMSFSVGSSGGEAQFQYVDLSAALAAPVTCNPNLPIVARASDAACILQGANGTPAVIVPHATITALQSQMIPQPAQWVGESGAFDLWMALLAGSTAVVANAGASGAAFAA